MSETTHTPGPWNVVGDTKPSPSDPDKRDVWVAVQTDDGAIDLIAPALMAKKHQANARLIAAAPDLLAALNRVLNEGMAVENGDGDWVITNAVLADVVKAARSARR